MDGGYVKSEGGESRGVDGARGKAVAIVNSSFVRHLTFVNSLFLHRQKFSSVTLIGFIEGYNEASTKIEFRINDGEGPSVKVLKWKTSQGNNDVDMQHGSEPSFQDGSLVRVFGNPRRTANNPDPYIIAYQIFPVTNLNEWTMHNIEIIASSMVLNKRKNNVLAGLPPHSGFTNSSSQRPIPGSAPSLPPAGQPEEALHSAMKKSYDVVLKAIQACPDAAGISRDILFKHLRSLNQAEITTALDFLMTEGHIYTTTDDYHYKSTDG